MITILSITLNRDVGLRKMLQSVKDVMTGEYFVIIANCSDDKSATDSVISEFGFAISFHLDRKTSIHESYNILIECVESEYWCWLSDDCTLEKDIAPLIEYLTTFDMVALPMKDTINYEDNEPTVAKKSVDKYGCMYFEHRGKRFANHALLETSKWKITLSSTSAYNQIDKRLHAYSTSAFWPEGVYINHIRNMDETRKNRVL